MRNPNAKGSERSREAPGKGKARGDDHRAERAQEKTKGQERDEAENPSPSTGTTGQSDAAAEQSTQPPSPEAVEQNKATRR